MKKFKNIQQIWAAIDAGQAVYWASDAYQLTIEETNVEYRQRMGWDLPFSNRDGKCLRVTCMSNWFGSLLLEKEINQLYTKAGV
jgi:hypothetical protein